MAKPNEPENNVIWGTLEELLLACAVNRYGTSCWDSVAREVQKRSSAFNSLSPHNCKQKYHDLKRRFNSQKGDDGRRAPTEGFENDDAADTGPWLDELRKLRIAELKRELERYDVSIVSLQSKVKKLKEEREKSLRENAEQESDLQKNNGRETEDDLQETKNIPQSSSPEGGSGREVSGGQSDRENLSVNESNSTDPKDDNLENRVNETEKESTVPVTVQPDPTKGTTRQAGEASYNGSSETIAPTKESVGSLDRDSAKGDPVKESVDSPELESVAESKGGEEGGAKESSDVQSSASLSRKLGREKAASGSNSGEEPVARDQSLDVKSAIVKSQPLVDFLEIIRSYKHGSMFERRLESQETSGYKNLIRQHVDLRTIRTRLDEGRYSNCQIQFYRDLLLLINNAIVFFNKNSSEHKAAIELRLLLTNRLPHSATKHGPPPPPPQYPPKPEPEAGESPLLLKPKLSAPVIACRKRSSIVAKSASGGGEKKREAVLLSEKEEPAVEAKQEEKSSLISAVTKRRTRDQRFGSRNSSKNSRSRSGNPPNKNLDGQPISSPTVSVIRGASGNDNPMIKLEKKSSGSNPTTSNAKKQSAANFLNRMRRSSSLNNGSLLDSLKSSAVNAESSKVSEQKKIHAGGNAVKSEGSRDQSSRKGSSGKQAKEKEKEKEKERSGGEPKKNVGRPPKRVAAVLTVARRRRESGEAEAAAPKKRQRK